MVPIFLFSAVTTELCNNSGWIEVLRRELPILPRLRHDSWFRPTFLPRNCLNQLTPINSIAFALIFTSRR